MLWPVSELPMHPPIAAELILRDPGAALQRLRADWSGSRERWIFGYASLIWRPEFDAAEHRSALLHGWHRALRMRSRVNRGTAQRSVPAVQQRAAVLRGVEFRAPDQRRVAENPAVADA